MLSRSSCTARAPAARYAQRAAGATRRRGARGPAERGRGGGGGGPAPAPARVPLQPMSLSRRAERGHRDGLEPAGAVGLPRSGGGSGQQERVRRRRLEAEPQPPPGPELGPGLHGRRRRPWREAAAGRRRRRRKQKRRRRTPKRTPAPGLGAAQGRSPAARKLRAPPPDRPWPAPPRPPPGLRRPFFALPRLRPGAFQAPPGARCRPSRPPRPAFPRIPRSPRTIFLSRSTSPDS